MIISFLFLNSVNTFAVELITQIKGEGKNVFKTLTRKSLTKEESKEFLYEYVIIINDERGDGLVTYYFDDGFYKRYKGLELISKDKWGFSITGYLKLFNNLFSLKFSKVLPQSNFKGPLFIIMPDK